MSHTVFPARSTIKARQLVFRCEGREIQLINNDLGQAEIDGNGAFS
jgi:hypothetical protein